MAGDIKTQVVIEAQTRGLNKIAEARKELAARIKETQQQLGVLRGEAARAGAKAAYEG